ncbi:MAG: hypothetical protein H0W50_04845 [Parachlamydiaceae bacterium]|nr:hypothetical protein [Parachlamydiaceae bacterium]
MRKVVLFQTMLALVQIGIMAQPSVPYTTSSVQGSTIITNFIDPNAGPAAGPGLPISPLESRFNAPIIRTSDPTSLTSAGAQTFSSVNTPSVTNVPGLENSPAVRGVVNANGVMSVPSITNFSSSFPQPATGNFNQPATNAIVPVNAFPRNIPGENFNAGSAFGGAQFRRDSLVPINTPRRDDFGSPDEPTYLFPGLVRFAIDKWVGSDYLYSISPNIGVVVEIIYPTGFSQRLDANLIKQNIQGIFSNAGINPVAGSFVGDPPLPFFHLIIFATPVEDYYVFSISGRLFEAVRLARLNVRLPGTMQAITWEKQELIVASKTLFFEQLLATSREIAQYFTQRVNYFRRQLIEQEDQLRLNCGPRVTNDPFAPRKMTEAELYQAQQIQQPLNPCQGCR